MTQTTAVGVVMTGAGRPQAGGSAALATDRVRPTSMEGQAVLCSQHGARDQRLAAGRKGPESRSRCTRDGWSGGWDGRCLRFCAGDGGAVEEPRIHVGQHSGDVAENEVAELGFGDVPVLD